MQPFKIHVAEDVLEDLHRRLESTRWPRDFANDQWQYGANTAYLREVVDFWLKQYDWRERERAINAFPHFRTMIDGVPIHFIHVRGKGPNPMPLMLNHGWPWSFWDYQKLIGPLSDPAGHGGNPEDAFDIIVPSLPGYGFSTPLEKTGVNFWNTADLWVKLMAELGYDRFATQGADWGAFLSAQLGHKFADHIIGVHIQLLVPLDSLTGGHVPPEDFLPDNAHLLERNTAFFAKETGYLALQTTKPQTPAVALNDSPAGLLAWIVEKRRTWSDCGGDVERSFTKSELIDTAMIYWITESYGTSARYYYEAAHNPWSPSHDRLPVVEAPVAAAIFPGEVVLQPRKWAERYYNLKRWTEMPRGGHFGPMENPDAVIADVQEFFRGLRS